MYFPYDFNGNDINVNKKLVVTGYQVEIYKFPTNQDDRPRRVKILNFRNTGSINKFKSMTESVEMCICTVYEVS